MSTPSIVMKMDIEGSEFAVLSRMLSSGVLCALDAAAVEWHDERYSGTTPIHKATGAPSNFTGLLSYVISSSQRSGSCGINLVDLKVEST